MVYVCGDSHVPVREEAMATQGYQRSSRRSGEGGCSARINVEKRRQNRQRGSARPRNHREIGGRKHAKGNGGDGGRERRMKVRLENG